MWACVRGYASCRHNQREGYYISALSLLGNAYICTVLIKYYGSSDNWHATLENLTSVGSFKRKTSLSWRIVQFSSFNFAPLMFWQRFRRYFQTDEGGRFEVRRWQAEVVAKRRRSCLRLHCITKEGNLISYRCKADRWLWGEWQAIYSLVQLNWFSDVDGCMQLIRCICIHAGTAKNTISLNQAV